MDDLISRQAAIDACNNDDGGHAYGDVIQQRLRLLPSAQPEKRTEERTKTHACDLISRQAVELRINEFLKNETYTEGMLRDDIHNLPSALPERNRGKWIIKDNPGTGWYRVTCSECGEDVTSTAPCIGFYPNAKVIWDYCPNCGADMREVDDERPD